MFLLKGSGARGAIQICRHNDDRQLPQFGLCFARLRLAMESPGDVKNLSPINC